MGSTLSCIKPRKEGGAVRPVPERRPVSASEIRRPSSSFSAGDSVTLEQKRRRSVEGERTTSSMEPVVDVTEVLVSESDKVVPAADAAGGDDVVDELEAVGDEEEKIPVVGSTSDEVGATGNSETEAGDLVDIHVRAEKALVTEVSGISKLGDNDNVPDVGKDRVEKDRVGKDHVGKDRVGKDRVRKDRVGKDRVRKVDKGKGVRAKTQDLQRSDTMLDVRRILPVRTHVANYEKIDADANVNPEEMVKSGKYKVQD